MPNQYPWVKHPEAILGLIYLYVIYGDDVPDDEIDSFVARHQDRELLDGDRVRIAMRSAAAVAQGTNARQASKLHKDMWAVLQCFFPVKGGERVGTVSKRPLHREP